MAQSTTYQAIWNGTVIAESNNTVRVEGNEYFPADSVRPEHLQASTHTSSCPWKGIASYHSVVVDGTVNTNAAWFYPEPKAEAASIKGHIAFWKGVEVKAV